MALLLNAAELGNISGRDVALASSGVFQLVGDIHQVTGNGALAGTSQVGGLVTSLGSAQTAQTSAVEGRSQNDDLLGISQNTDHVRDGRVDFDEVVGGLLDDGQDLVLFVLEDVGLAADRDVHTVDLHLLLGRDQFDLLLVEQDGDDLLVVLFARQNGELVAARAILGQELVAAGQGGVVVKTIVGGDGLGADQADA